MAPDDVSPMLINYRVWGLWEPADAHAFERQAWATIGTMGIEPGAHRSCLDLTEFKIQSQAVVQLCLAMVMKGIVGERCAFIVGAGLARIQIKRVTGDANIRQFTKLDEARAWLLADQGNITAAILT